MKSILASALFSGLLLTLHGCGGKDTQSGNATAGGTQSGATLPGGPGNPGSPGNPGNPGEPGNPGNPGNPGDPGNPNNPGSTSPEDDTSPQGPGPGVSEIPNSPACKNLKASGHFVGSVAPNVTMTDNLGRQLNLHDFCEHTLLVLAGASTCPTCNLRARTAARLMRDRFTDGRVKLIYMLSLEGNDEIEADGVPATIEHAQAFHQKHQFGRHALTLVDGDRKGLNALWPDHDRRMNSMVLRRGFRIVTKGPGMPDFEQDVATALATPDDPVEPEPEPENPTGEGNTTEGDSTQGWLQHHDHWHHHH